MGDLNKETIEKLIYSLNTLNMLEKLAIVQSVYQLVDTDRSVSEIAAELDNKLEVAATNRKKQMGEFDSNPEWYTPSEFIEMARYVMGTIDTDPASNDIAQSWIQAKTYYTKEQDGYRQNWSGNVWCNPPYGRDINLNYGSKKNTPIAQYWLLKGLEYYKDKKIDQVIFLVNRTGANWYREISERFSAVCEVKSRIAFHDRHGQPSNGARYYNDFLYLGKNLGKFNNVFAEIGRVLID